MSLFLTPSEIKELTGYKRAADQRRWLNRNGWPYALDANDRPKVARSYAERRLSGETAGVAQEPDFSAVP